MDITRKQNQIEISLFICCVYISLLFMVSGTDSAPHIVYATEMEKINASVEEDRVAMKTGIDTAFVSVNSEMNNYCAKHRNRNVRNNTPNHPNREDSSMMAQDSSEILKRYAADRRACACLFPLLVEKYAAQLTAKKQDPEKVQDTLTKIAQDLFYNYSFFLEENHEDNHLETVITTEHAALCDKWKAAA
ncbi:hypothetical protein NECID01_1594, partial [Nematocida sp. AWRm77]